MLTDEERKDYEDLLKQVNMLQDATILDIDGDGQVSLAHIQTIMTLLGEPKCPPERIEEIKELFAEDTDSSGLRVQLSTFLIKIRNYLQSYGSEKEFLEAFKIFDEDGTGLIPINSFRYFMLKYAQMDPHEMDEMICDILGLKRITPLDPSTKVDYKEFGKKLFDKNYGKAPKPTKGVKGSKPTKPKK